MEEQLPTPINELIILNLYLGSVTLLLGIGIVALIIYRNGKFNWTKFALITTLLIIFGSLLSIWVWMNWSSKIDIMFGPIHLPTLISIVLIGLVLIKLFRLKILKIKNSA